MPYMKIRRYKIQHSIDEYTFPKEAYIQTVMFDEKYIHIELADERIISIPFYVKIEWLRAGKVAWSKYQMWGNTKLYCP